MVPERFIVTGSVAISLPLKAHNEIEAFTEGQEDEMITRISWRFPESGVKVMPELIAKLSFLWEVAVGSIAMVLWIMAGVSI